MRNRWFKSAVIDQVVRREFEAVRMNAYIGSSLQDRCVRSDWVAAGDRPAGI